MFLSELKFPSDSDRIMLKHADDILSHTRNKPVNSSSHHERKEDDERQEAEAGVSKFRSKAEKEFLNEPAQHVTGTLLFLCLFDGKNVTFCHVVDT